MIKKLSLIFLILAAMNLTIFAQKPQAYKFDEFQELPENEWKQRLDKLIEMQISMPRSKPEIIVYAQIGTDRTSISNLKKQYTDYLIEKKVESAFVVSGGFRQSQTTEFWIVPKDAKFPSATPNEKFKPEKFAEFEVLDQDAIIKKLKDFDTKMMEEPATIGYIINYGKASEVAEREKKLIESYRIHCFGGPRLTFVNGGNTGELKTVFWIVPPGAEPPTP